MAQFRLAGPFQESPGQGTWMTFSAPTRRALSQPSRTGGGLQFRREDPGPGVRPHPAIASHEGWPSRDHDARLQAQRHHGPIRRDERRDRRGPLRHKELAQGHRRAGLLQADRSPRRQGPRHPRRARQPLGPQSRADHDVAGTPQTSPVAPALHANLVVMAEPGRRLVLHPHQTPPQEGHLLLRGSARRGDRDLGRALERRPHTLRLEEARRRDHRQGQAGPSGVGFSQIRDAPLGPRGYLLRWRPLRRYLLRWRPLRRYLLRWRPLRRYLLRWRPLRRYVLRWRPLRRYLLRWRPLRRYLLRWRPLRRYVLRWRPLRRYVLRWRPLRRYV